MKHSPITLLTPTDFHISTSNNNVMDMGMDIHNSSELSVFFLLSSTLYKEPYRAIVRELVSNAIDASKQIGTNEPVVLHVPKTLNDINNEFYVQDFGIGMSLEKVINIYGNYFASSKQNDSNSIGGFGLGGKTPFIYVKDSTDGFKLETTSPEDGVRRTFMFYMVKNAHGGAGLKPVYRYLDHLDVENSSIKGSKVSFKLHDIDDIANFTNAIDDVLLSLYPIKYTGVFEEENVFDSCVHKWTKKYLNLNLTLDQSKEIYTNLSYDKMKKLNSSFYYFDYPLNFRTINSAYLPSLKINNVSLILGNIFYQYTLDDNDEINQKNLNLYTLYRHISILDKDYQVNVGLPIFQSDDNGNITLALSRENIQKTEHNDKIIIDTVNQYLDDKIVKTKEFLVNMLEDRAKTIKSNYHADKLHHDNGLYGAYEELNNVLNLNQYYQTLPQLILDELSCIKKQYENMIDGLYNCFIADFNNHSFEKQSFEKILKDVKKDIKFQRMLSMCHGSLNDDIKKHEFKLVFLIDSVSKIKTRKQKDIVFDNFLKQHIDDKNYFSYIVMSSEQFDIVSKFGTQFRKVIDLNPSIEPLIEEWKNSKSKNNNQSEKNSKDSIKSKLLENEFNCFYMINFEDGFKRNIEQAKQSHDLLPKHLNLDIVIKPITLPKTIKLDIYHDIFGNPTFIKNIQFLIKIGALRLNDKNILINESFLSRTNYFIGDLLDYSKRNKLDKLFDDIPSTVFRPISNIIKFNFIDNNQFADLDNIDIFQYINDEINVRLDDVYKQLEKQINFKDFFFTSVAKKMFSTYHFEVRRIFSPFDQLMTKDENILKDILLNKMSDVSEEALNQYFDDEHQIMKYMIFSDELGGFVDCLKYHFKHIGLSKKIKTFNDFFEKHGIDIIKQIQYKFPHNKTNMAGFKYSKELYLDYVKPLLVSFDEN